MSSKEKFFEFSYEKLKTAIETISSEDANDIYALSFYFYAEDDDGRYPTIEVSFNTNNQYKNEIENASSETEAKWNYAFWLQEEIERIGGEDDTFLAKWFKETPYYYSEIENEKAEDDDELFDKLLEKGEKFEEEFVEEILKIIQKLFTQRIIFNKFGKDIPILVHELEYYDKPINWTKKANKFELIKEFINAFEEGKI
ncbi:DUF4303 domain-containing protein [Flavobacterium sp. xlx-214]|uniref:DUF4303 domain-containing protein n=1 Tax=unclassified Flavobacterium TaxID=196869 RepID=UPI0013D21E4E|nr:MULTISPECIES: DUF4303 domain-containing protein [unclassified Flavobacterium]MBA5794045.1 DUF4303 domain-containing protein [Flavobacterium sp. xlx-221]QMI83140.1 DUF4303 domain-containing protein [Flavobacterium sp. xlx-214]